MFGSRGTGKSTWLKHHYPEALYRDLLAPDIFRSYSAKPGRLSDLLSGNPDQKTVIIDEVQRIPELLPLVHKIIEDKPAYQFILTGSSSRKLKRSGTDLLAGRALLRTCHPFMAAELGEDFSLDQALLHGMLPIVHSSAQPADVLAAYVGLYLREEVQMERLVRRLDDFSRFLEAISYSHASLLNTAAVARECKVNRKTVENYITILEDLLLGFRIPVFSKHAKRRLISHEKFCYFDAGVFRSLRPAGPLDLDTDLGSNALEGLVAEHLRTWLAYSQSKNNLFFWRTKAGNEVDFIVYGASEFTALKIKNSQTIHPGDLIGLKSFQEDYPTAKQVLLYRGQETLSIDNIMCMPCEEFLKNLTPDSPLPII
ncbi:MAG TPA: ATP-binding protein [Candidatus Wirthbacteria bacterium]|nr:ATP-binding protein [Candidatus Wirthbacteria bacterium]